MASSDHPDKKSELAGASVLTRVFMECSPVLHHFLRRFLHRPQDIEDVVQETYLKAYAAEKVTEIGHPRAYLFSIAKNIALGELLKKSSQITGYIEECKSELAIPSTATIDSELEAQQSVGVYCEAIAQLPEKCRRVFLLRKVHGLRQREIAETLGISVRMVEKHLRVGTLKCRAYINEQQQGEGVEGIDNEHNNVISKEDIEQ